MMMTTIFFLSMDHNPSFYVVVGCSAPICTANSWDREFTGSLEALNPQLTDAATPVSA